MAVEIVSGMHACLGTVWVIESNSLDPSKIAFVSLAAVANRAKPLQRTMPSRHIEVQCGGGGRLAHGHLANVRTPVGPTGAAQPLFRLARSSPNLCARPSLTRSNRRGTDPYARWCGRGGAARHPPIPILGRFDPFAARSGNDRYCAQRTDRSATLRWRKRGRSRRRSRACQSALEAGAGVATVSGAGVGVEK